MGMNVARVICLALMPLAAGYSQHAPGPNITFGLSNGRLWLALDDITKAGFLVGCSDGLFLGSMLAGVKTYTDVPEQLKWPDLQNAEIVKELDLFYSEGANVPVPIVWAINYVRHKAMGDTPEQLQQLAASLRRRLQSK